MPELSRREAADSYIKGQILSWMASLDAYDLRYTVPLEIEDRIIMADEEFNKLVDDTFERGFDAADSSRPRRM